MKTAASWSGPVPVGTPGSATLAYTPPYLAEKILTSRSALEGERKQVMVLFADLKGSMELLADRDPEEARQLLDPVLERMTEAVHRYEGTVNQVMGDGIMALFGAPIAHEDHAVRACYAALAMQASVQQYAAEVQRSSGELAHCSHPVAGELPPGVSARLGRQDLLHATAARPTAAGQRG
jgi:class 3 adenylate cyclase